MVKSVLTCMYASVLSVEGREGEICVRVQATYNVCTLHTHVKGKLINNPLTVLQSNLPSLSPTLTLPAVHSLSQQIHPSWRVGNPRPVLCHTLPSVSIQLTPNMITVGKAATASALQGIGPVWTGG